MSPDFVAAVARVLGEIPPEKLPERVAAAIDGAIEGEIFPASVRSVSDEIAFLRAAALRALGEGT